MKKILFTSLLALVIIPLTGTGLVSCSEDEEPQAVLPQVSKKEARAELKKKGIKKKQYDDKLFSAAMKGDCELLQLLILAGADVNKHHVFSSEEDSITYTPLSIAVCSGSLSPGVRQKVVEILLSAPDINPNVLIEVNGDFLSALEFAERNNMMDVAAMLREAGAR